MGTASARGLKLTVVKAIAIASYLVGSRWQVGSKWWVAGSR